MTTDNVVVRWFDNAPSNVLNVNNPARVVRNNTKYHILLSSLYYVPHHVQNNSYFLPPQMLWSDRVVIWVVREIESISTSIGEIELGLGYWKSWGVGDECSVLWSKYSTLNISTVHCSWITVEYSEMNLSPTQTHCSVFRSHYTPPQLIYVIYIFIFIHIHIHTCREHYPIANVSVTKTGARKILVRTKNSSDTWFVLGIVYLLQGRMSLWVIYKVVV